ncbi:MAG: peptidylprolyl isomerase [Treponema sp.]|nr:peptidylprolyl isomerase [Treponema sp.]
MDENRKAIAGKDGVFAIIQTTRGDIVLELFYQQTPLTAINFVGLAEGTLDAAKGKHFYDGLKFHRVIADFMVQGGDPKGNGSGGPGYQFPDEFVPSLKHDKPGMLSMANSGPGTNGSQFFITHVPTPWLDGHHTVFGQVIKGQDVVNTIQQGDEIKKIEILRQGNEAKQFSAAQKDFDLRISAAKKTEEEAASRERADSLAAIERQFAGALKSPEGIYYLMTKPGTGAKAGANKQATVHYKGYLLDGTVFDSSYERNEPIQFMTAARQMIPGFDLMIQDMTRGEKRTIVLPPEQAYGSSGAGGVIPPNAFIVFDVELVSAN